MGLKQSKDELLYQQVNCGNSEGVRALRREGAGLEWIDRQGKTPLTVACMSLELYNEAKTLIELGANVNASSPGRFGGTPLHHAAARGLEPTIKLLLSNGANALAMNGGYRTPLDVARSKGYTNIVRAIEGHVCLFSGWLRELHGPGFLERLVPHLLSRRVWVVVLPCGSCNSRKSFRLELAIYTNVQDAQPRTIVPIWKSNLVEPIFNQPDPVAIISNISTIPRRWRKRRAIKSSQVATCTRIKLVPVHESEKQQLLSLCNACKGTPQARHPSFPSNNLVPTAPAAAPSTSKDEELAMAIEASLQSASQGRPPHLSPAYPTNGSSNKPSHNDGVHTWNGSISEVKEADPSSCPAQPFERENHAPVVKTTPGNLSPATVASTPLSTVANPVVCSSPSVAENEESTSSSCTICLDADIEGACIPCGHMVGCMSCLNEIKAKKFGCPVCRSQIDQVVRIYAA